MEWVASINKKLESNSIQKIIIWSAGNNTKKLLTCLTKKVKEKIISIVDVNKDLDGTNIESYKVTIPGNISFNHVDAIIVTSLTFHLEIVQQIKENFKDFNGIIVDIFDEKTEFYQLEAWCKKNNSFVKKFKLPTFIFDGHGTSIITDAGIKLHLSEKKENNQFIYNFIENKSYETAELNEILSNLSDGGVFFDIGANIGWFSLNVAKRFRDMEIHAFEPNSSTFSILKKNIEINDFRGKVIPNQNAVCESDGPVFFTSNFDTGNHILKDDAYNAIRVDGISLDSYVRKNKIGKIDFIKCDIEGAELFMLKGAHDTLRVLKPGIMLEIFDSWCKRFGYTARNIFEFMSKYDYTPYELKNGKAIPFEWRQADKINTNLLFLSPDHDTDTNKVRL